MTFSPADHLGAAQRRLSTVTRDGDEMRMLTVTRTYDAAPDEVWAALTTAAQRMFQNRYSPVSAHARYVRFAQALAALGAGVRA